MRLYAALVSEETDQPELRTLYGLGRSAKQMERLETMVADAWSAMEMENQARPVASGYQCVFLAPEYFFSNRREANDRFFLHDVKRETINRLRALSLKYPKMLIVPGTVLWTKELYDSRLVMLGRGHSTVKKTLNQERLRKAVARIQGVGQFGTETNAKDWSHSRDFATQDRKLAQNVAYLCLNGRILKYQKVGNYKEVEGETDDLMFVPGSIVGRFKVGNVLYAIEICMDHALGVFDSTVGTSGKVHVQLVVSSYVSLKQNPNAAVTVHSSTEKQTTVQGETAGTAQVRFSGDKDARLARGPIKKAAFTVWCVDIDNVYAGNYVLSDTALQQVGA